MKVGKASDIVGTIYATSCCDYLLAMVGKESQDYPTQVLDARSLIGLIEKAIEFALALGRKSRTLILKGF